MRNERQAYMALASNSKGGCTSPLAQAKRRQAIRDQFMAIEELPFAVRLKACTHSPALREVRH